MLVDDIYLGLGSNLGDKVKNIKDALNYISDEKQISIVSLSSFYRTSPIGNLKQDFFINQVIQISSSYSPLELWRYLSSIENKLGRKRGKKWGPRIIDIDILFYGTIKMETKNLVIPHRELLNRLFVLVPLCEIAADFIHPFYACNLEDLMHKLLLSSDGKKQQVDIINEDNKKK